MDMRYFQVIFEREANGAVSAYVPGYHVYAQADTQAEAERTIQDTLDAYLDAHPDAKPIAEAKVARVTAGPRVDRRIEILTAAALVGGRSSRAKARASRANGRLGGRPKHAKA